MLIHARQKLPAAIACLLLASCSVLDGTARLKDPVVVDKINAKDGLVTEALTSDRRLVVFYPDGTNCPEAPPDTSSNIAGSASAAANIAATAKDTANASAAVALIDQMAVALSRSTPQSQGSVLMRFAFAYACTSAKNGMMNEQEYNSFLATAFGAATSLTLAELSLNGGKIGGNGQVSTEAPTLSGAQASDFAASTAAQAAKDATKDAGTKTATEAAKSASDAVKAKSANAPTPSPGSLALSAGTAAHDAVLAKTGDTEKALVAQLTAVTKVIEGLGNATGAPAPASTSAKPAAPSGTINIADALRVAQPFSDLAKSYGQSDDFATASAQEVMAFKAMLAQDADAALAALNSAYNASPRYHNISEIRGLLQSQYTALKAKNQNAWKKLYSTIVTQYSWRAPPTELARMRQLAQ